VGTLQAAPGCGYPLYGSGIPAGYATLWRQGAMRFLARILLAWGFWVQVSTLPELLDKAWYEVGPFETREQCEYVRAGAAWAGRLYRVIDPCIEWQ